MKKVLLIAQVEYSDAADGVQKKVRAQVDAFERLGNEVYSIFYFQSKVSFLETNSTEIITLDEYERNNKRFYFWKKVKELISEKYDLVFIRYSFIDFQVLGVLKKINHLKIPIIIEIPSIESHFFMYKGIQKIQYGIDKILNKSCKKYVDKVLYIGEEEREILGCLACPIPNGLPYGYEKIEHTGYNMKGKVIRLLAVSTMGKSRGYDRVVRGCANYCAGVNEHRIEIVFVGEGECIDELKKLVHDNKLEKNVFFRGKLKGEALEEEYRQATLGIGGLGLFHLGGNVSSTLKIREYLWRGLPFIYSGKEVDIPLDFKYALHLENNDTAVDMSEVIAFANRLLSYERVKVIKEMSDYAIAHFEWKNIIKKSCGDFL